MTGVQTCALPIYIGKENNLPFVQHVKMNGQFKKEVTDFAGLPVKPKDNHMSTDIQILKYLNEKELVFKKEKYEHSYPHCWRCKTPLLNYAANSWFVKVTDLKKKMVKENDKINWIPDAIGRARFGNWIADARDWAMVCVGWYVRRIVVCEVWCCNHSEVLGSIDDIKKKLKSKNKFFFMRHGQSEANMLDVVSDKVDNPHSLTDEGKKQVEATAEKLKEKKIDIIIASPFVRTKETAKILSEKLGLDIAFDERIQEPNFGSLDGKKVPEYYKIPMIERFDNPCEGGESLNDVRKRMGEFIYEIDKKYDGKNILIVSHDFPGIMIQGVVQGMEASEIVKNKDAFYLQNAEVRELDFAPFPHNRNYEIDLHRPYIDEIEFKCSCGGIMKRIPDVFDCWYESGSMPYAQFHYPFENKEPFEKNYPANFIAEGLDQTRGWFYSLLVLSTGLFGKAPYKNVVVNGIILAEDGQKMSKSLQNYPDPVDVMNKYGADAIRYYMLSSPVVRAEALSFTEKGVGEVYRKVIARLLNVLSFYEIGRAHV